MITGTPDAHLPWRFGPWPVGWHMIASLFAVLLLAPAFADPDEDRAADAVKQFGGTVTRDPDAPGNPVVAVSLVGTEVTDADLKALAGLAALRDLDLSGTLVTDAGLKALARFPRLQQLSLSRTALTDAGVNNLVALKGLVTLELVGTRMTPAGIQALRNALPQSRIVTAAPRGARRPLPPWVPFVFAAVFVVIVIFGVTRAKKDAAPQQQPPLQPVFEPVLEPTLPDTAPAAIPAAPPPGLEGHVQPVIDQVAEHPLSAAAPVRVPNRRRLGPSEPEQELPPPRARLFMQVIRVTGDIVMTALLFGVPGGLLAAAAGWPVCGLSAVAVAVVLYLGYVHGALYVTVREGSQGLPIPQPINTPLHAEETGIPTGTLAEMQFGPGGLLDLGFEPAGWFYLDNHAGLRIGVWRRPARPDVAYIMLQPGGSPRLRFLRRFVGGLILATTNRKTNLGSNLPASVYLQMRDTPSPALLWSWHREATALFPEESLAPDPNQAVVDEGCASTFPARCLDEAGIGAMELHMEMGRRLCEEALRVRWWWLPCSGAADEIVRMSCLPGMSVRQQIEQGWAAPVPSGAPAIGDSGR